MRPKAIREAAMYWSGAAVSRLFPRIDAELKIMWVFFYPMILSSIATYLLGLADYHWIRDLSHIDLAIYALTSSSLSSLFYVIGRSLETNFVSFLSRQPQISQARLLPQGFWFSLWIGLGISAVLVAAGHELVRLLSGGNLGGIKSTLFYALTVLMLPLSLLNTALCSALRVLGDAKSPASISIRTGILNNVLDPLCLFVVFAGVPSVQLFGLVLSSWLTRVIYLLLCVQKLRQTLVARQIALDELKPDLKIQWQMARSFAPSAALETLTLGSRIATYSVIAACGIEIGSGYAVGFELLNLSFVWGNCLSMIFMIRMGQLSRTSGNIRTAIRAALTLGAFYVVFSSLLYFTLRGLILPFLLRSETSIAAASLVLDYAPLFIASYFISGLVNGTMQSLGQAGIAMACGLAFSWVVSFGVVFVVARSGALFPTLMMAMGVTSVLRIIVYSSIFRSLLNRFPVLGPSAVKTPRPA